MKIFWGNIKWYINSLWLILLFLIPVKIYGDELTEVSLQLKWHHQFQFAGYYMALEKGYYREAGLDVIIKEGGPGIDVHKEVSEGRADFGILGAELLLKRQETPDLTVLAPVFQHSIRTLYSLSEKGILSPHDLIGKKIMLNAFERPEFLAAFLIEGVDIEQLDIIPKDTQAREKLIRGEVDAVNGSFANESYWFQQAGISINQIRPISYGVDFYGDTLFSRHSLIRKMGDRAEAFKEASLKGWEYAFNNPEESVDVVLKYNPHKERGHLFFEYARLKEVTLPDLVELGHNSMHRWNRIMEFYQSLDLLPEDYSLDGFYYNPEEEREVLRNRFFRVLLSAFFVTLITIVVIYIINKRLKHIIQIKTSELILREKLYRSLVETAAVIPWELRMIDRRYNYIGPQVLSVLGYTPEECHDLDFLFSRIYEQDRPGVQKHYEERREHEIEYRIFDRNNRTLWIRDIFSLEKTGSHEILRGFFQDITVKKKRQLVTENILKVIAHSSEEKFFNNLLKALTETLSCSGAFTGEILPEEALCRWKGYSQGEAHELFTGGIPVSKEFYRVHFIDDRETLLHILPEEELSPLEFKEALSLPLTDLRGECYGWIILTFSGLVGTKDLTVSLAKIFGEVFISEIKSSRDRKDKARLEVNLAGVINSMPSVIAGVNRGGRINLWNSKAESLTGKKSREVRERCIWEVFPDMEKDRELIEQSIDKKSVITREKCVRETSEGPVYENYTYYPVYTQDEPGVIIRIDDITNSTIMEESFIQNEKMLSLGGLAAGMAHEIKNPLAGIIQTVYVLKNRLLKSQESRVSREEAEKAGITTEGLRKYMESRHVDTLLNSMSQAGRNLSGFVENMLSFSRRSKAVKTRVDIAKLITSTLELAKTEYIPGRQVALNNIRLEFHYDENLPQVPCDESKIEQVILNILRNGIFSLNRRKEEAPASWKPRLTFHLKKEDERVLLIIKDNGTGMSESVRENIFKPFFTTKTNGRGTGLGLSVSYYIVTEYHRGAMTVESTPGDGAAFYIWLPLNHTPHELQEGSL